jgi:hypothetical protein
MKNFLFNLLIVFTIVSCSGGGEGGGDDSSIKTNLLPVVDEVSITEFLKLIPNYDPIAGKTYSFSGSFNFNKENKICKGDLSSSISISKIESSVISSGYCAGKESKRKIKALNLEFLNIEKISEALGEDLKIYDLGSDKYRLSFENQENWVRSYIFKIDQDSGTILFPVTLHYRYSDQYQKMNWKIDIRKEKENIDPSTAGTDTQDAMDLAEYEIYSIF